MPWRRYAPPGSLLLASLALFWTTLNGFFTGDDFGWLHSARYVMNTLGGWLSVFTRTDGPNGTGTYRPLSEHLYFWLSWLLFRRNPLGYHALDMVAFLLSVLASWLLLRRVGIRPWVASCAVSVYALSTIHFEALQWVAAMSETGAVMCAAFAMLGAAGGRRWPAAAWYGASLLCDETATPLPAMLFLWHWLYERKPFRAALRESGPSWIVFGAYTALRVFGVGLHPSGAFAAVWNVRTMAHLALRSLLWSVNLTPNLRNAMGANRRWGAFVHAILLAGAVGGALLISGQARRANAGGLRLVAVGVLWWLVGLAPILPVSRDYSFYNLALSLLGAPLVIAGLVSAGGVAVRAGLGLSVAALTAAALVNLYGPNGLTKVDGDVLLENAAEVAYTQMAAAEEAHPGPLSVWVTPDSTAAEWILQHNAESELVAPGSTVTFGKRPRTAQVCLELSPISLAMAPVPCNVRAT